MQKRVVVTGIGIITAFGAGFEENLLGVTQGRDSTGEISAFDVSGYRGRRGAEVSWLGLPPSLKRLRGSRLDRSSLLLFSAFSEAIESSGLKVSGEAYPLLLGTTLGGMLSGMEYHSDVVRKGYKKARASKLTDYQAHAQPNNLKREYELSGEAITFSDACTSGASAIGHGFRTVRCGKSEVAIAGGYDTMCEFTVAGFNSLQAISTSTCKPFDKARDGLVLGEGAGILVLEELDHALERGAKPIAEIIGYGESSDSYHLTSPDPEGKGAMRAMKGALIDGGVKSEDVDYINAHGTGTLYNDRMEALAIKNIFSSDVPVSSTKAMVGHTLGGAGAIEAIFTIMAIREGFLPPNINIEELDPECDINVVSELGQKSQVDTALSNSFGFGGANASLLFRGYR